jgi:hypothetical protein
MKPTLFLLLASSLALGACTKSAAVSVDAGPEGGGAPPPHGAFQCVAALRASGGPLTSAFNASSIFTMTIDPDGKRAIVGGGGKATEIALTTDDGRSFRSSQPFVVGASLATCPKVAKVSYTSLAFLMDSPLSLSGTAMGTASITTPALMEAGFDVASFVCQPDDAPPRLVVPDGVTLDDPLTPFQLWTSKPLPATALARMVGGDGAVSGLVPEVIDGRMPLIASFAKANVTLATGQTFQALFSDDVVDLAGHLAPKGDALPLGTIPAAPLIGADGFESATGDTVGGAAIVTTGGLPLAGQRSAYIALPISPRPSDQAPTPKLVVRMTVPPGATKLTFTYRELTLGSNDNPGFVQLGSVGRAPGAPVPIPAPEPFEQVANGTARFYQSPISSMIVPLPGDVGQEVIVLIETGPVICNGSGGRPGILLDDLRLE